VIRGSKGNKRNKSNFGFLEDGIVIKLKSFVVVEGVFQLVELEVISQKGLPHLQFIGLPDQVIKESGVRIKSAIKSCGFQWPQAKQIIVNLKPSHLKKSSRGLEFAVAVAILLDTQQIPSGLVYDTANFFENTFFYGELDLEGHVYLPEDFVVFNSLKNEKIFTGFANNKFWCSEFYYQVTTLKDLLQPQVIRSRPQPWKLARPRHLDGIYLTAQQKELVEICVLGNHHLLMMGAAGSGKSLLAEVIHNLRCPPDFDNQTLIYSRSIEREKSEKNDETESIYWGSTDESIADSIRPISLWRPIIKPHHSLTPQGLIGGGLSLNQGELTRAHLGTLVFDELLEYKPATVEALREPLESGQVRVARASGVVTFQSQFLWIATSNLCPCGEYVPGQPVNCRYSLQKCRSYGQKLSGPLVDRFDIMAFTNTWKGERLYSVEEIVNNLEKIWIRGLLKMDFENLPFTVRRLMANWDGSFRRKKATLRVATSIAQLNDRNHLLESDVEKALNYTVRPFASLQRWD
jgi:magnesium chelatase family protein